jgi:DNA-binding transcriptional MerR regulator
LLNSIYSLYREWERKTEEGKIPNIYLIKDLARLTGYSIHTLKYYLKIGLIREIGRSPETNFRYFDDTTIEQLKKIRSLRKEGKSIAEIKET